MKRYEFLPFEDAREIVRKLGLRSSKDWYSFIKGKSYLLKIPTTPRKTYSANWVSWMDWLGYSFSFSEYNRRYKVNEDFFKKWSRDMAYVLGFWWADGCISKGDCFSISQHKKDSYILSKILEVMNSRHKISKWKNQRCLNIYSVEIVKDIRVLGGKERKSLDIGLPNVPKEYFPDFLRGYFDGDGCICYNKNDKCYISRFTSGSKLFAEGLLKRLKEDYGMNGSVRAFRNKNKDTVYYATLFNKNDTIRLKSIIYYHDLFSESGLVLKRKYDLFSMVGEITRIIGRNFLPYEDAQKYANNLRLKSSREWYVFCSNGKPDNIPFDPRRFYKDSGWVDWEHWLGHKNVENKL